MKYTSHEIQNELLSIMSLQVIREIASQIQSAPYFTVMIDEATDLANIEQVILVIHSVNDNLTVTEDFIGLYKTESIESSSLVSVIKDVLLWMNLKLKYCRGQCYDGGSNMTRIRNGVAKQLTDEEPRAIFTHSYGHALNLAVGDTVKKYKLMRSCLDAVFEITKLIKKSPEWDAIFQKLKHDLATDTPSFRVLCPTSWTVRAASLQSVLDNYEVLGVWEESKNSQIDSEMKARIIGIETQMLTFNFLFGISLRTLILPHSDNLSKSLQHDTIIAAEGQQLAKLIIDVLKPIHKEDKFKSFYDHVLLHQSDFDIDAPTLYRKRYAPRWLQIGLTDDKFHSTPEDNYRQIYYEALDLVIEAINSRFNQPRYKVNSRFNQPRYKVNSRFNQPRYKVNSRFNQPRYKVNSKFNQPRYKVNSRFNQPRYKVNSRFNQPGYKVNSRFNQPRYKVNSRFNQPRYKVNSRFNQPRYKVNSRFNQPRYKVNSRFNQPRYKVNSRFNQPRYKVDHNVEDLVLNACRGCPYDTELSNVCDFYKDDIYKMQLQAQLPILQALFAEKKNQSELSITLS